MHSSYHSGKQLDIVLNFEIITFIVCMVFILFSPFYLRLEFNLSATALFLGFGGAVISYFLLILLSQSNNLLKDIRRFHQGVVGRPLGFKYFWYPFLVSIPEELLFRLVLPALVLFFIPIWPWNVLIASILFGMAHIRKGISPLVPLTAFAIGVVFAVVYELSGKNMLAPILAHFIFTLLRVYKFGNS